jgi:hypothetical protein
MIVGLPKMLHKVCEATKVPQIAQRVGGSNLFKATMFIAFLDNQRLQIR